MNKVELADFFIERLNHLVSMDSRALTDLATYRVPINNLVKAHPSIQLLRIKKGVYRLGTIGLINSIIGSIDDGPFKGQGYVSAVYDGDNIIKFERTDLKPPPITFNRVKDSTKQSLVETKSKLKTTFSRIIGYFK
jgi:hypothetical protein